MKILKHLAFLLFLIIIFAACKKPEEGNYKGLFTFHFDSSPNQKDELRVEMVLEKQKKNRFKIYNTENTFIGELNMNKDKVDGWFFEDSTIINYAHMYHEEIDTIKLSGIWFYSNYASQFKGQVTTKYITILYYPNDPQQFISPASGTFEFYN